MLDKPDLADELIVERLRSDYHLAVKSIDFLPIGNDRRAASYFVRSDSGDYFLKLRRGGPKVSALQVPRYLRNLGINNVVAPVSTAAGELFAAIDGFALILYPYVRGKSAWKMSLTAPQWRNWGQTLRAIHDTAVSAQLEPALEREVFGFKWLDLLERVETAVQNYAYSGDVAAAMARLWRENAREIDRARSRYLALGEKLSAQTPPFVLCHADIHTANIIIDQRGEIHIVDWDETLTAPKERDLMFFLFDGHSPIETEAFFAGYGDSSVDWLALAYYKYDWVLQEFGDYGERVFLSDDLGAQDLAAALREFERLFAPGDVLERAHQAYGQYLKSSA